MFSSINLLTGCNSINTDSLQHFSRSVEQSKTTTNTLLAFNNYWAKKEFIHDFVQNKNSQLSKLKLQPVKDFNYSIKLKPLPLFMTLQQNSETINRLNSALYDYSLLLLKLSNKSLINKKSFDQLTKKINQNATEAVNILKVPLPAQNIQLLSQTSAAAMQLYLKHRQRNMLQAAIKQNQPNIEKYAASVVVLLNIIKSQLNLYYSAQASQLIRQWHSANQKTKIRLTGKILELNQSYIIVLKNLKELNNFYTLLPQANRVIGSSLSSKQTVSPALIKLNASAEHLLKLQKTLKKYLPAKNR
jgi:hypothetical protein